MKKILLFAGIGVVVLGAAGGGFAYFTLLHHKPAKAVAAAPKPILFATLPDIVVSIPDNTGDPPSAFVQFAVEFSTTDPKAVAAFGGVAPIIKSQIINLLMNETGAALQSPANRATLTKNCLNVADDVVAHSAGYIAPNPFTAAYITNLVVQD